MDIDWPRTLATGGITTALLVAVYLADAYETYRSGEVPAGPVPGLVGGVLGLVLALVFANAFL